MPKRRKQNLNGKGFMDVVKKIGGAVKKVVGVLKDTKLISTVGSMVPHAGIQTAARAAGAIGLGRRKRKRKAQKGGAMNLHGVRSTARPVVKL